ncbi:hypothetical protein M3B74_23490 [Citrobacter freundii]|uniref:hypothetical protein n=1 Tax=Citrobacter TaxID=544 RepID=UPI0015E4A23C|nr:MULTISPECIES: hypothetical protein [Citrobacter]EJT6406570.1 hypothetical protein [Escherichia coli]ELE9236095.1 hypothetical protein [Enterobacter kobei]MCT1469249.1 hypothetical protein [Citrobacter freundii]MCT1497981.1 hypothetical protein [Citrobacter freundii]MDM3427083.1 hypothetical protein [Citrobacter sp. Cb026]
MRGNKLHLGARISLFIVSYLPLFFIMCFVQLYTYKNYLNWAGITLESVMTFLEYFGAVTILVLLSLFGLVGLKIFLKNIKRRCQTSGRTVKILDIENKNNESISYLFTYLIPFVFQDLSKLSNVIPIAILLMVTALIYINSSMILINPTISIKYTLYQISYLDIETNKKRTGMILTKSKYLEEDDLLDIEDVGPKLFYAESHKE